MTPVDLPYVPILLNEKVHYSPLGHRSGEIFYIREGLSQIFFVSTTSKDERYSDGPGSPMLSLRSGRITDSDPRIPENLGILHS
ncbi:hypothetical protein TNCV_3248571 [Trichonephila clavipes]|nr:hypothetical protein TNCV_3248571 [Trichonephila clavipes]